MNTTQGLLRKALEHAVEIAEGKRSGTWDDLLQYRTALSAESFCDANCTWRDHQPGCGRAAEAVQPVGWRYRLFDFGHWGDWRHQAHKPQSEATATFQVEPLYAAPLPQGDGADAKDAARYRCLRKGNDYEHDAPMALLYEKESDTGERPFWSLAGEALDDAVDTAMRASSATEEGTTK